MLALIAGSGSMPGRIVDRLLARGSEVRIFALEGEQVSLSGDVPLQRFRVETLGSLLADLKAAAIREVCFVGGVRRPVIDPRRVDAATAPLLERLVAARGSGDDAALRTVVALFEEAGLFVVAAHDVLPEVLPDVGVPTTAKPSDADGADAARGAAIVAALGQADVGQACVVAEGQALAVEAAPGTDWMLDSLVLGGQAPGWTAPARSATVPTQPDALGAEVSRGLLYKAPKPGQDRRVDLPTIGLGTVERAATLGLRGIVIEAGGVMGLDVDEVIAAADAAGLFLWIREPGA
ncbi:MAG: UDP-2,3-diacylglucosamine diphosphatase LpxI [Pseudomonadota bacterium]